MNNNTFEKIGFYELKLKLSEYASSGLGKELITKLKPSSNLEVVKKRLDEVEEAKMLLDSSGGVTIQGIFYISPIIDNIEKGIVLEPQELLNISDFLRGCRRVKKSMELKANEASILSRYALSITDYKNIEEEINFTIQNNAVSSDASKELKKIRKQLEIEKEKIQEKIERFFKNSDNKKYIQEFFVSERNGHFTIPIKAAYKNQIEGIIVDESAKGGTAFIEPNSIAKHSIKILELKSEEAIEEYNILSYLTGLIFEEIQPIKINVEVIAEYDMIFAKAKYANAINAIKPEINNEGFTRIVKGRHPLLEGEVVALDFEIGKKYRSLVITGPNAGGKTVVLKAVGLLTIATQLGLWIPAEKGTNISIFERIFVDIGDNQSIENALSTFSSHVKNLADIIKNSNKSTLLLFDEIGSGTEPNEGAGIAIAILEYVYKKGCVTVATTHYGEIKNYSQNHPDFENAAMKFDKESLEPCYKLLIGQSGQSNALWIARKMGINEKIIETAEHYITNKIYNYDYVLESKIRKTINEKKESLYEEDILNKGDMVIVLENQSKAIVYQEKDKMNNIIIFQDGEMKEVNIRRVRLKARASELYPEDYNLNDLFVSFKERKLEHDIKRGSKKAIKKIEKEVRNKTI